MKQSGKLTKTALTMTILAISIIGCTGGSGKNQPSNSQAFIEQQDDAEETNAKEQNDNQTEIVDESGEAEALDLDELAAAAEEQGQVSLEEELARRQVAAAEELARIREIEKELAANREAEVEVTEVKRLSEVELAKFEEQRKRDLEREALRQAELEAERARREAGLASIDLVDVKEVGLDITDQSSFDDERARKESNAAIREAVADTFGNDVVIVEIEPDKELETVNIEPGPLVLNEAALAFETATFQFGHKSQANIEITNAPAEADFSRWAMLNDGETNRLFVFPEGTDEILFQFGFNSDTQAYEFGFGMDAVIPVAGIPVGLDTSSFAMLHDGENYMLYFMDASNSSVHPFFLDTSRGLEFIPAETTEIPVLGGPEDIDLSRWAMLDDGSDTVLFVGNKDQSVNLIYAFPLKVSRATFEFGDGSLPEVPIDLIPENSDLSNFAMLHDGEDYRLYFQAQ